MYRLYQHVRADHGIAVVQFGEQGGVRAAQVQPVSSAAHLSEGMTSQSRLELLVLW
jgi:hypothetical protein